MNTLLIHGGRPLAGTIRAEGNKNAALPLVAAAVAGEEPVLLENVPDILDVRHMVEIARGLGVAAEWRGGRSLWLDGARLGGGDPDAALCEKIRASFLLAAPLLARRGRARMPRPGGDVIGRRRLDTHVAALRALGAEVEVRPTHYELRAPRGLRGAEIFLDEASVTATEQVVVAAALAKGTTVVRNAASEPHVQEVCRLVAQMGARIEGIGSNVLTIEGVARLGGGQHTIGPDHIEVGSFIGLAAVTNSAVRIQGAAAADHPMMRIGFGRLGLQWRVEGDDIVVPSGQELRVEDDLGGAVPKIDDAPWPGFPADLVSIAVVVASQARGTVLIHEKMFESRLFFTDKLVAMGARIVLCDPHRALVTGPARLRGAELTSPDIRAGMAMLIAALAAEGTSTIRNVRQIDRGYARIDERLQQLGADIRRIDERKGSTPPPPR